jgi:hypothetical protein
VHGFHGNLNDRNQAAHPTAFDPGVNETLGYIEGLLKMAAKIGAKTLSDIRLPRQRHTPAGYSVVTSLRVERRNQVDKSWIVAGVIIAGITLGVTIYMAHMADLQYNLLLAQSQQQ